MTEEGKYKKAVCFGLAGLFIAATVYAVPTVIIGRFSTGDLSGWTKKSFKGETQYGLKQEDGGLILLADSRGTASGLVKEQAVDLKLTPILHWRWKMIQLPGSRDERTRQGDDYAARVYVIKRGGLAFWRTKAINYVWSANQTKGAVWENAFAGKNAMMIAVRGKNDSTGVWFEESIDVPEDFKRLYGEEISTLDAVAIMTDTDNAGGHAIAEYGDIYFTAN